MEELEENKEVWVTSALTDADALQVITLGISLKTFGSSRKICILVSEGVSQTFKDLLTRVFHEIVLISNTGLGSLGIQSHGLDFAVKLWCWKLTNYRKCVYLTPNHVAKKNCDELFGYDEFSAIKDNKVPERFETSLFVFKPSLITFNKLVEVVVTGTHGIRNVDDVLHKVFESNVTSSANQITGILISEVINENGIETDEFSFLRIIPEPSYRGEKRYDGFGKAIELLDMEDEEELDPEIEKQYEGAMAVVGMSCRFPGANNTDEYWKLMAEGREAIRKFPVERVTFVQLPDALLHAGFLNCAIDEFDAKFFGISPREAVLVDPQQRLLLEVTWECLENAGINPQTLRNSDTGVYVGMWQQDYERVIFESKREEEEEAATDFLHVFLGNKYSATASRISFCLGLHGPAVAVESGCSSSLTGLHLACQSLRDGETSLALVSGVNLILLPINPFSGKADDMNGIVLSRDFKCKTFDEGADGFARAEGCGVIAVKRYEDARRDGDNILAIIKGSAVNNDGTGTSFGTPNDKAQERVYRAALKRANVAPAEVSFVETHGTGTVVGDPIEMFAVGQVYSEGRTEPLWVGSVKTNIGHSESAAGIAGLIKVILCLQNKQIPPHRNFKTLNPRINLDAIPARIPLELTPWTAKPRIAAVSSFSMSATNAHVIVQEPPKPRKFRSTSSKLEMITISTKSEESLTALVQKYVEFLKENRDIPLKDISYAANVGRAHLQHRIALVAGNTQQLLTRLENKSYTQGRASTQKSKVGYLFTGQGSQYFGMTRGLSEAFPAFRKAMNQCDALFQLNLGESLSTVLFKDESLVNQTLYCQPAIFCIEYCLTELWSFFGIKADGVLGHSVGEFAAAVCAGVLTLSDAMKLVSERSRMVNDLPEGSMLAIRASEDQTKELIKAYCKAYQDNEPWVDIAAINSAEEVVVSLNYNAVKFLEDFCANSGVKYVRIPATHAFHSRDMDSILPEFGKIAETVSVGTPTCTYVSGTLAKTMESMEFGAHYWQRHLRDTVRFSDAVKTLWSECKTLVEIGAQPILLALAMQNVEGSSGNGVFCPTQRKNEEPPAAFHTATMKLYVSGVDFAWESVYGIQQKYVNLPTYPFQRQKYWIGEDLEFREERNPVLHPLLGKQFLSPIEQTIFCQTLRLKQLKYIEDHKVADYVVVPAAGLLETFLAAGREVLQGGSKNKFSITVENFQIEAALALENKCNIQTLVTTETTNAEQANGFKYKLSLSRKLGQHFDKWKRHATAEFSPSSKHADQFTLDLEALKASLTHKKSLDGSYKAIADIGINFGPKFQSITSAWYGTNKDILAEIPLPDGYKDYICHPIVLDAMIQACAFREHLSGTDGTKKALYLPISIRKFSWLSRIPTSTVYAHCTGDNTVVTLYTATGEPLATMEGLELIQTTVNSVVRAIREDAQEMPDFMVDKWRQVMGKMDSRVEASKMIPQKLQNLGQNYFTEQFPEYSPEDIRMIVDIFNTDIFLNLCRSIQECDWPWAPTNEILYMEQWKPFLPAAFNPRIIISYFYELERRGYVAEVNTGEYTVLKPLPTPAECEATISTNVIIAQTLGKVEAEMAFSKRYGTCLPLILQGKLTPLAFMFPEDESEAGTLQFYNNSIFYNYQNAVITAYLTESIALFQNTASKDGVVRILEVGAGSASTTAACIEALKKHQIPYHYTFTDISPLFLNEAMKKLGTGPEMTYQLFNIEEDPLSQGFSPEEFDCIIGVNVVHATVRIEESLANLKRVLKVNGILILGEIFEPNPLITFLYGMLDGWWRYDDFRVGSKTTALLNTEQWTECLERAQFDSIWFELGDMAGILSTRNVSNKIIAFKPVPKQWLLLNDSSSLGTKLSDNLRTQTRLVTDTGIWADNVGEQITNFFNIGTETASLEGIVFLCTQFESENVVDIQRKIVTALWGALKTYQDISEKLKSRPKIIVVTRGVHSIGDSEPGNPNGATAWGIIKSFRSEVHNIRMCLMDLDSVPKPPESLQVFSQLWNQDDEMFVAFRPNKTYMLRLTYMEKPALPVALPNTDRYKFINPDSGSLADIEFGPVSGVEPIEDEVEVEVRACALNFRDLFMIMKPEGFEMPNMESLSLLESPGLDFSGIVTAVGPQVTRFQVGDEVCGLATRGALASHTMVPAKQIMKFPSSMSFAEASTLPVAFATVVVSLVEVAKITAEDRVLIHVATGGVGLAAIQVVKRVGAEIYATAGSKRKRAYLRGLGIQYVYHSRDTTFADGIERDTNGTGMTVVLNSLTGPGFKEAALRVSSQGARFVEIARMNIWTPEEVKALRPDVRYTVIDLSKKEALKGAGAETVDKMRDIDEQISKIQEMMDEGSCSALPFVTYPLHNLREAFNYFQKTKQIGKIVVEIPKCIVHNTGKIEHKSMLFNARSTYLITGGLGGLGIEVTKWMRSMGAQTIILVGRSLPSETAKGLIDDWNRNGTNIIVIQTDVGDFESCRRALETIKKLGLPPLRGIMHAAGVLKDDFIKYQTLESIEYVFGPKVYGGWNLHSLTLDYQIDFFIMFSSLSGVLGMMAQCNHGAANRFLDALIHYRVSIGLPGTTINWGAWSDVGAAAHIGVTAEVFTGMRMFTPAQGISALEKIMTGSDVQVGVSEVMDWNLVKNTFPQGHYFDEMKSGKQEDRFQQYDYLIEEIKQATSFEERQAKIQIYMEAVIKETLGLPPSEVLDIDQNFTDLGLDSLMAMEMKNQFQAMLGDRTLSISSMQENRTIRSLSTHLAHLIENECVDTRPIPELIKEDVVLPEEVRAAEVPAKTSSAIKHILLTGGTGYIGIHCLVDLVKSSQDLVVHCLIRSKSEEDAWKRLTTILAQYGIDLVVPCDNIRIIVGDMVKPRFGLTEDVYANLAEEIDGIMHFAARVDHVAKYNELRANIRGMVNVLKFASTGRTKSMFYASSLPCATKATEDSLPIEEYPAEKDMGEEILLGYFRTKFICEKLALEASKRGIPVTTLRFPLIFGNSVTGFIPKGYNHLWATTLASIRIRMIPKGPFSGAPIMAVDSAAKVTTMLFLSDTAERGLYNITPGSTLTEKIMLQILSEHGVNCEPVTWEEWRDAIFEDHESAAVMSPMRSIYQDEEILKAIGIAQVEYKDMQTINLGKLNPKILKNFPNVADYIASPELVMRRQIQAHFNGEKADSPKKAN